MRLAPLLAALSDEDLERLAVEHVRTDERLPRPQLCNFLESAVRSYRFVNDFIINRQPPTFSMLTLLLDAPGYELRRCDFEDKVIAETRRLVDLVASGDVVSRDGQLRLYRRALYEARRSDLDLNSSEAAILAVLRRECGIAQVEHFLIEHHQELREFWDYSGCYVHEQNALRSAGLLFFHDERVVIPEELAPAILQALGIDMPSDSARRLFSHLSNVELAGALEAAGSRTSGSKDARLDRLLLERIQPHAVLRSVGLPTLREICRATNASVSGNKEELIERIIDHFAQRRDQWQEAPAEPPKREARQLEEPQFETLFSALHHQELSDILRCFPDFRQTGTKEVKIKTLWQSHLSEQTLLGELMNRQLEDLLHRLGLRLGGAKRDRIERVIGHFSGITFQHSPNLVAEPVAIDLSAGSHSTLSPEILEKQALFRQRASNPQASLQPWLEQILGGVGLVRCYATEDANPTKQLKNKLSQASAARGGLLVLMLADEGSFMKARDALLNRWMTNVEWPKSIACVALAHPLAAPNIEAIVEHTSSPWPQKLQELLFPSAELFRVEANASDDPNGRAPTSTCEQCGQGLPSAAKFCPECGRSAFTPLLEN